MKVLITGATGLIGSEIVKQCLSNQIKVHYLTTSKAKIKSAENYQGFYWNPSKKEIDLACFVGVTSIINLAGSTIAKRWTPTYKKQIIESRTLSLITLKKGLNSVDNSAIKSFVSASAIGIYPNSLSKLYTEEEPAIADTFLGESVKAWEQEIRSFTDFNFPVSTIRIGLVLSAKGGALSKLHGPVKGYVGAAFGTGKQWQSWIHVTDLSRMFLYVIQNNFKGIYNGVSPNPVSNKKMTQELAKALKRPLLLPNIPKFVMRLILGEMSSLLFESQKVSSKKIEQKGFVFKYDTIAAAIKEIYS